MSGSFQKTSTVGQVALPLELRPWWCRRLETLLRSTAAPQQQHTALTEPSCRLKVVLLQASSCPAGLLHVYVHARQRAAPPGLVVVACRVVVIAGTWCAV